MSDTDGRPFRPRRGRSVPLAAAGAATLICAGVGAGMVRAGAWGPTDLVAMLAFGALITGFLLRYAVIRAVPTEAGLVVRNLFLTRTVRWPDIVAVLFPDGDPWVSVELADTDVVAVMAVQRADGEYGRAEARRLAALVAARSGAHHHQDRHEGRSDPGAS
ncbi:MAG: PH domain-containing protein [Dermatophilaceae bacterium]